MGVHRYLGGLQDPASMRTRPRPPTHRARAWCATSSGWPRRMRLLLSLWMKLMRSPPRALTPRQAQTGACSPSLPLPLVLCCLLCCLHAPRALTPRAGAGMRACQRARSPLPCPCPACCAAAACPQLPAAQPPPPPPAHTHTRLAHMHAHLQGGAAHPHGAAAGSSPPPHPTHSNHLQGGAAHPHGAAHADGRL